MTEALPSGDWLNVGSGPSVAPGWISIDGSWQAWMAERPALARVAARIAGKPVGHWPTGIVCRDVRNGLGRPPESAAVVYSSHFIEHLSRGDLRAFLAECRRVLRPGGVCRIVTPDLRSMTRTYLSGTVLSGTVPGGSPADAFVSSTLLVPEITNGPRSWLQWYRGHTQFETHKWLYDADSLSRVLTEAGFRRARACEYLESRVPTDRLRHVEIYARIANGEGVVVEAER